MDDTCYRPIDLTARLVRWTEVHALLMIASTTTALVTDISWFLPVAGAFSFTVLILATRHYWTEKGSFGWANAITVIRLGGILTLGLTLDRLDYELIIGLVLLLLVADGCDGWLARRLHEASEFGEYFDKETDAFFVLILSVAITSTQRLGHWILTVGLLRYLFVLIAVRPSTKGGQRATVQSRSCYLYSDDGSLDRMFFAFSGVL